jgi:hypothetical protein
VVAERQIGAVERIDRQPGLAQLRDGVGRPARLEHRVAERSGQAPEQ